MPPGRPPKLAGHEEELGDLYCSGVSLRELGERFGAHPNTVRDLLKKAGFEIRPGRGGARKGPPKERSECQCGCGRLVRRPGARFLQGHHLRRAQRERVAAVEVEPADEEHEGCQWRSPPIGSGLVLRAPACGRPVRLAGARYCPEHDVYSEHYTDDMRARQLREPLTVRCSRCGGSWESSAMRAKATYDYHLSVCPAREAHAEDDA